MTLAPTLCGACALLKMTRPGDLRLPQSAKEQFQVGLEVPGVP